MTQDQTRPLTPPRLGDSERDYVDAVIRRVEHLTAGDDALARRTLRILTRLGPDRRRPLATVSELDVAEALGSARTGTDVDVEPDAAQAIDEARDRIAGVIRPPADEYARRGQAHADRLANGRPAEELVDAARARYHRDPLAHMRAELAARLVERHLGKPSREAAIEGAAIALELVETHRAHPAGGVAPAELARGVMAGALAGNGAPAPAELAAGLVEALERAGLRVAPR